MLARMFALAGLLGLLGAALLPERLEAPTAMPASDAPGIYGFVVLSPDSSRPFPLLVAGLSALAILVRRLRR